MRHHLIQLQNESSAETQDNPLPNNVVQLATYRKENNAWSPAGYMFPRHSLMKDRPVLSNLGDLFYLLQIRGAH